MYVAAEAADVPVVVQGIDYDKLQRLLSLSGLVYRRRTLYPTLWV